MTAVSHNCYNHLNAVYVVHHLIIIGPNKKTGFWQWETWNFSILMNIEYLSIQHTQRFTVKHVFGLIQ